MATKTDSAPVSLRPMSLRPGGGSSKNPFERFAKGAGAFAVKAQVADVPLYEEEKKKPRSEVKVYGLEFLEAQQETNVKCPPELSNFPELQINTLQIEAQRPIPQADDRDWRGRSDAAAAPAPSGATGAQEGWQNKGTGGATAASAPSSSGQNKGGDKQGAQQSGQAPAQQPAMTAAQQAQAMKMQKAEDLGRTAWQKGETQEGHNKTMKEIKGILNKLTPEKFDILSKQLLQLVTNSEILHGTITLIFENAVAQPTFVAVYADLCDSLSKALPESLTGADRSKSFKSILLNTCQDQFEEAANNRAKLATTPPEEREEAERRVKSRTLGNIRLIAELFNKGIVAERIVTVCIEELLGDVKADPVEDNVEALCELLSKAGKKLEATTKSKAKFDAFFVTIEKLSKHTKLAPRLKFLLRDVVDLRKSKWIPRRDVLQAKKIDEIHAEAHAELGMMPTPNLPLFQALPALPASVIGPRPADVELFPAFRGGDSGWQDSGALRGFADCGGVQQRSAFFLDVDPLAQPSTSTPNGNAAGQSTASSSSEAGPAAHVKREPLKNLSEEDRESRAKSLFSEYASSRDVAEATACVEELTQPAFMPKLVRVGVSKMLDAMQESQQQALAELLVKLVQNGSIAKSDFLQGLQKDLDALGDLMMDYPVAPKALGYLYGQAVLGDVVELKDLTAALEKVEECEPKRKFTASCIKTIEAKEGEEKTQGLCKDAKLNAATLFEADPEIDFDQPSVADFLKTEGFEAMFT